MKLLHWLAAFAVAVASAPVPAASTIAGSLLLPNGSYVTSGVDPVLHRFYAVNTATGALIAADVDTMQVVGTVAVDDSATRLRVDAAHHRVYVLHSGSPGQITTYDGKSLAVIARTTLTDRPLDLAMDFRRGEIYVIHDDPGNHFTVFDTRTNTVAASLQLGAYMYGVTVDRTRGKIYVPQYGARQVVVISQARRKVIKTIPVGMYPLGAVAHEKDGTVYISGYEGLSSTKVDQVVVIDSVNDELRATLPGMNLSLAGVGRFDPVPSAVYGRAYFSSPEQGLITVADTGTDSARTVAIAGMPTVTQVNANDGEVYVVDRTGTGSATVTVLDARLERVAGTLDVGLARPSISLVGGRLLLFGVGADGIRVVSATPLGIQPGTLIVTDFHHAGFDHYFHTASDEEARVLEDGAFGTDWLPTQQLWRVWKSPGPGRVPVCRFSSSGFGAKSSHIYTPYAAECEELKKGSTWTYEETPYYVALPDAAGACRPIFEELYRLYNNSMGGAPNHAYTNSRARRDALQAAGWSPEGSGLQSVFACTPPLKGFVTSPLAKTMR